MNKYTYTVRGSKTTTAIAEAPRSVQAVWNEASVLGINIIRVRKEKERYETQKAEPFLVIMLVLCLFINSFLTQFKSFGSGKRLS